MLDAPQGQQVVSNIHETREPPAREPLPHPDDRREVWKYAMSFKPEEVYGSFKEVAKIAEDAPRSNLNEVRAELLIKFRASRANGSDTWHQTYEELKPYLIEKWTAA